MNWGKCVGNKPFLIIIGYEKVGNLHSYPCPGTNLVSIRRPAPVQWMSIGG